MLKGILWDNDGVLVDTERLFFMASRQVLAEAGIALTEEKFIEISLVRGESVFQLAEDRGAAAVEQLRDERNALYSDLLSREPLMIDGVGEVLEALHGRYAMGIVTSSRPDHFAIIHKRSGLLPYFQFVLTLDDYSESKPHPEPYLRAVACSGFSREECLVIEDSERGLASAIGAGIRCIVIPSHFTRGSNFEGAYRVLNGIRELPEALEKI